MKIRTQFILTVALCGIAIIVVAAYVIISNQRVVRTNDQAAIADNIQQEANDLSYLANDYLLYGESQQLARWESRFASLSSDLGKLNPGTREQQTLVDNVRADQQRLEAVFNDVKSGMANLGSTSDLAFIQVSWSRMEVQSQGIVSDASRLTGLLQAQADHVKQINVILIFVLIGTFVIFFVVNYLLVNQRLLKSISILRNGAAFIGAGNLDFKIEEERNDEIGDMSRAFNRMTSDLKTVTASKSDLEREIEERRKAEERLVQLNRQLRAISDCNQAIVRSTDERTLYADTCRIVCQVAGYRMAWVGALEHDEARSVRPVAWHGDDGGYLDGASITWADTERGRGPTGTAARTGKTDFCQDFAAEPKAAPWREAALARGFRSSIAVPLLDNKSSVLAVFNLYAAEPNGFTPAEVRLLEELAGDVAFGVGTLRTQRERVKAENALRDSEERFRSLFDHMNEGFGLAEIILDADGRPYDYRWISINRAWGEIIGVPSAQREGKTLRELNAYALDPWWIETYGRVALTGEPAHFEKYAEPLKKWLEVDVYSPRKGHFAVLLRDITARKKAEAELAHLASFPRLNPLPIVEMDSSGAFVYANPAAQTIFPDLTALGAEHPLVTGWDALSLSLRDGNPAAVDREIDVGGSWYDQTVAFVPQTQSLRFYSRDITQRKKAEQALNQRTLDLEASNKELESFSYSVSHDLRAPLRIMDGYSHALLEDYASKLDEKGKDYLRRIRSSSQTMAQLIDDILNLSRITRSELQLQKVNLSELARQVAGEMKAVHPQRQVDWIIAPQIEGWGDRYLLKIVFENLLGNAFKFTGKRPRATIEFGAITRNGEQVYFVRDNGAGFDMAYMDKLFIPFQRLHTPNDFPGTGVGLASVQRIISRLGGKVWAEGEVDKGATIYFTLRA